MHAAIRSFLSTLNIIPARFRRRHGPMPAPRAPRAVPVRLKTPTPHAMRRTLHRLAGKAEMTVSGAFGRIVGAVDDYAVLERYACEGTWCPVENAFFAAFFARHGGGTYLDIGANIGLTTIAVASNPAVHCLAFEPEPANFRHLRRNIEINCPADNVELFSLALLDRAARLPLQLSPTNKGDHRVRVADADGLLGEAGWPVIHVDARRLDDVLDGRDLPSPLAAKLVAQGAEAHIVAGGPKTLSRAAALVVEIYPYGLQRMGADADLLLRFMAEHFCDAAVIPGGTPALPSWERAAAVVAALRAWLSPGASGPADYVHVFLRK